MDFFDSDDCIIACSTGGVVNSAIAIIRISGFPSLDIFDGIFSIPCKIIKNRYAHFCKVLKDDTVMDEVVLTFFKGPNSFNGENILELSVHGNSLNVQNIINFFCDRLDIRKAFPGEFSYRALRNKKLSLIQVEGLDLFLNANNPLSLKQGMSLLNGSLQDAYLNLYHCYKMHKSSIELSIDFMDDVGEEEATRQIQKTFGDLKSCISVLKDRIVADQGSLVEPEIVLVGEPNAGKSSLFNSLLKNHRAIVSDVAGTTRDYISEVLFFNSSRFKLIDTAGVRQTNDAIESAGINKTWQVVKNAFYKILVINPFETSPQVDSFDVESFDLVVFTNADRKNFDKLSLEIISKLQMNGPIEPLFLGGPMGAKYETSDAVISGPIGAYLKETNELLNNYILNRISLKYKEISNKEPILLSRHADQIKNIYNLISTYELLLSDLSDISIVSSEFNIVGHCISELVGIISPDEILDNIFQNFCIGK